MSDGGNWVTIKGAHVQVDGSGNIISGGGSWGAGGSGSGGGGTGGSAGGGGSGDTHTDANGNLSAKVGGIEIKGDSAISKENFDAHKKVIEGMPPALKENVKSIQLTSKSSDAPPYGGFKETATYFPDKQMILVYDANEGINDRRSGILYHEAGHSYFSKMYDGVQADDPVATKKLKDFNRVTDKEGGLTGYSRSCIEVNDAYFDEDEPPDSSFEENFAEACNVFTRKSQSTKYQKKYPETYKAWKEIVGNLEVKK